MSLKNPKTTPDRLAAYRKACERWRTKWKDAVKLWGLDKVKQGPEPTPDMVKPEKCEPKDFGLTEEYQVWADKIWKDVFRDA